MLILETPWGVARVVRPWSRHLRFGSGLACAALSLVLPWLGDPLTSAYPAWKLPLRLGAVPLVSHLSYATVEVAILVIVILSTARQRAPTPATRWAGAGMIALATLFVVATRVIDARTMFTIHSHFAEHRLVVRQFGYGLPNTVQPSSVLGVGADGATLGLFSLLRPGWYLLTLGGFLLVGTATDGRPPPGRDATPRRPPPHPYALGGVLAGTAVIMGALGLGITAQHEKLLGIQAERSSSPGSAARHLQRALRRNPLLRFDRDLELALGQTDLDRGFDRTALAELAAASGPQGVRLSPTLLAMHLNDAVAADPTNPVIEQSVVEQLGASVKTIGLLHPASAPGSVLVAYTQGRAAFADGNDRFAIETMRAAALRSKNADIISSCYTYVALAEQRQQDDRAFRRDIRRAVQADRADQNQLARETAAGLFVPGES